jgi:hypothetical protein
VARELGWYRVGEWGREFVGLLVIHLVFLLALVVVGWWFGVWDEICVDCEEVWLEVP